MKTHLDASAAQRRFRVLLLFVSILTVTVIFQVGRSIAVGNAPQNGRIAFESTASGSAQIGVVGPTGAGFRELTAAPGTSVDPAWSFDGLKVAFSSNRNGAPGIYVLDFLTGVTTPLTGTAGFSDSQPSWSPDGTKVAFERLDAATSTTDVWVVPSDGSAPPTNLTLSAGNDGQPAWSPDGTKIAFSSDRTGDFEIFVANADGTGQTNLTNAVGSAETDPSWSPDGTAIAFTRLVTGGVPSIWKLIVATPATQTQLVAAGSRPDYSPDGTKITFDAPDASGNRIWIALSDGTGALALATPTTPNSDPSWQPVTPNANPPIANAGLDQTIECTSFDGGPATLDGSASSDADSSAGTNDDIRLFEWWENFGTPDELLLGTGSPLGVTLPLGDHLITLQVTDSSGQTATDDVVVTIVDTTPPEIGVSLSPHSIWPPNHKYHRVHADVGASDLCSPVSVVLVSVSSNEDEHAPGSGNTSNDIAGADVGTEDYNFSVRAERAGGGSGRIYTAEYAATDSSGNAASASDTVTVPHDRGHGRGHGNGGSGDDGGGSDPTGGTTPGNGKGHGNGHGHGNGNGNGHGNGHGNGNGH